MGWAGSVMNFWKENEEEERKTKRIINRMKKEGKTRRQILLRLRREGINERRIYYYFPRGQKKCRICGTKYNYPVPNICPHWMKHSTESSIKKATCKKCDGIVVNSLQRQMMIDEYRLDRCRCE